VALIGFHRIMEGWLARGERQRDSLFFRPCLFLEKWFLENHFLDFTVFVCH